MIKANRDTLELIKNNNIVLSSVIFFIVTIIWVLLLGFGSPIFLIGGFIFGKWLGTLLVVFGLSSGATLLYIFANYFFKDIIKEKFSKRFFNLTEKFKKNEFIFFLIYRFIGGIPFFRLFFKTFCLFFVDILDLNPCFRFLFTLLGCQVLFIGY